MLWGRGFGIFLDFLGFYVDLRLQKILCCQRMEVLIFFVTKKLWRWKIAAIKKNSCLFVYWLLLKRQKFVNNFESFKKCVCPQKPHKLSLQCIYCIIVGKLYNSGCENYLLKLRVKGRPVCQIPALYQLSTIVLVLKLLLDKLSSKSSLVSC